MASAELLKMTRSVDGKVMGVDDRVKRVEGKVEDVGVNVRAVDNRVQDVGRDVRGDVQDVGNKVQGIDDKLDQVNRSLSLYHLLIVPSAQTASQGISSEIIFSDGFRLQIHPSIITLHQKLVIMIQLSGSFKAAYSINGNPPSLSYGYTENVRYFRPSPSVNS
jgi:hypothetical protein